MVTSMSYLDPEEIDVNVKKNTKNIWGKREKEIIERRIRMK